MARKSQEITIQIHICADAERYFNRTDLKKFWEGKIEEAVRKSGLSGREIMDLFTEKIQDV